MTEVPGSMYTFLEAWIKFMIYKTSEKKCFTNLKSTWEMSHLITDTITAPYLTCKSEKCMYKKGENFILYFQLLQT